METIIAKISPDLRKVEVTTEINGDLFTFDKPTQALKFLLERSGKHQDLPIVPRPISSRIGQDWVSLKDAMPSRFCRVEVKPSNSIPTNVLESIEKQLSVPAKSKQTISIERRMNKLRIHDERKSFSVKRNKTRQVSNSYRKPHRKSLY